MSGTRIYKVDLPQPITVESHIVEATLAIADVADSKGNVCTAEALRKNADGVRLFWDEAKRALVYRGPADALPYELVKLV